MLDRGRRLVGGSPLRVLRLSDAMAEEVRTGTITVTDARTALVAERLLAADIALPVVESDVADPPVPDLTVVIPTQDRAESLDRALRALDTEARWRVIVVDDGSERPSAVERMAVEHSADYLRLPTNRGPAAARNAGLARVRTPLVAFVDSDVEVSAADLGTLARHFDDSRVALVAPRVKGRTDGSHARWFERYDAAASSLDLGSRHALVRPGSAVSYLPSACLVGRRSALRDGFDESMRVGEDVDLVWRLLDDGHHVRYDPSVVAHHRVRDSMRGWLGRKVAYGSSAAALAERHGDAVAPAVLTPNIAVAAALVLWCRPRSVAVGLALTVPMWRRLSHEFPGASHLPLQLTFRSLTWGVRQEASLLLRHWWPATALLMLGSPRMRRVVISASLVDAVVAAHDRPDLDVVGLVIGRRLDDLAYGIGVWLGCLATGRWQALRPRLVSTRPRSRAPRIPRATRAG